MAVAGLAPRRAARPHHSRKPTRCARLGAKMAMSWGTSPFGERHVDVGGGGRQVLGHARSRSPSARPTRAVPLTTISEVTRSGWVAASQMAAMAPPVGASTTARRQPAASITASASRPQPLDGGIRFRWAAGRRARGRPRRSGSGGRSRRSAPCSGASSARRRVSSMEIMSPLLNSSTSTASAPSPTPTPGSRRGRRRAGRTRSSAPPYGLQSAVPDRPAARSTVRSAVSGAAHQAPGQLAGRLAVLERHGPRLDRGDVPGGLLEQPAPARRQVGPARRVRRARARRSR